jgi:steroid delta-isomerase-like uncharacterized protein
MPKSLALVVLIMAACGGTPVVSSTPRLADAPDLAALRNVVEVWERGTATGDFDAVRPILAADVHYHDALAEVTGADAVVALLKKFAQQYGETKGFRVRDVVYGGGREVGHALVTAELVPAGAPGPFVYGELFVVKAGKLADYESVFQPPGASPLAPSPAAIVQRFQDEVSNAHDPEALEQLLASDFKIHAAGQDLDRAGFKAFVSSIFAALPDVQIHLNVIEQTSTQAVVIETAAGTNTGGPFLGQPRATGKRVSFTVLHIYTIVNGRIVEQWSQPDFSGAGAQLAGQGRALTVAEMDAQLAAATDSVASDCDTAGTQWSLDRGYFFASDTLAAFWLRVRDFFRAHDASASVLDALVTPHYRLTGVGGLNADRTGLEQAFALVGAIGKNHDVSGQLAHYVGNRFIAAYGPVRFDYDNPQGSFGLPKSAQPVPVAMNELHVVGLCDGKLFRQYTHADLLGLRAQLSR